ncbi:hypothetical protein PR048_003092 [Dryococelus australis]|uniref:Reverse transcriptase RNase H-like domain-containing protein n=1 Tax=Dryococelus australis TaxID=614101 RepID=A0ABQ9IMM4_9NEOP|nr:hypothetical protein PR048_003092 [Dryococelus australis]
MPFGHINALSTFAKLMNDTLAGSIGQVGFVYLDDIVKCNYLGYIISEDRICLDKDKTIVIKEYLARKTVKEIRQFIGLVGHYCSFIPNFSKIAQPLTELTVLRKKSRFSGMKLHEALCDKPILRNPDFSLSFYLTCNSSGTAMAKRNYSVTKREYLSVMFPLKKWHYYFYGRKFTVITDYRPLRWLLQMKEPPSHLARWSLVLSEYDFGIVYKDGKVNANTDALSRISVQLVAPPYTPVLDRIVPETMHDKVLSHTIIYLLLDIKVLNALMI